MMNTNTTKTLADELRDMGYDCSTEGEALLERAAAAIERAAEREARLRDAMFALGWLDNVSKERGIVWPVDVAAAANRASVVA